MTPATAPHPESWGFTVGHGRQNPRGRLLDVDGEAPIDSLASAIGGLRGREAWYALATYRDHHRRRDRWEQAIGIGVDVDYHGPDGGHALLPEDVRQRIEADVARGASPGNLLHRTPRGVRILFVLAEPTEDTAAWLAAADGAISMTRQWLADSGLAAAERDGVPCGGLTVDEPASRDLARMYWAPRATVDGHERDARVDILRHTAVPCDVLASLAPTEPQRVPPAPTPRRGGRAAYVLNAVEGECAGIAGAHVGGRNATTNRGAFSLGQLVGAGALDRGEAETRLLNAAMAAGLPESEARPTIRSGLDAGERQPRSIPPPIQPASRVTAPASEPAWSEPIPLRPARVLPAFPTDCLPAPLGDMVAAVAEATQTPPDLAGMLVLPACSAVLQGHFDVEVEPGYREPLGLYTIATALPGERKTAVRKEIVEPIAEIERNEAERMRPAIRAALDEREVREKRLEDAKKRAAKGESVDMGEVEAARRALDSHLIPSAPRILADDATPEALVEVMASQGGGAAILDAEGGLIGIFGGRYSDAGPNLTIYLKGHGWPRRRPDHGRPCLPRASQHRAPEAIDRPAHSTGRIPRPDEQPRGPWSRAPCAIPGRASGIPRRTPGSEWDADTARGPRRVPRQHAAPLRHARRWSG